MKENRFKKICEYLCKLIERREQASEEQISDYISEMAKALHKRTKKQDFVFYELEEQSKQYQVFEIEDRERYAYMMGIIRGANDLYQQFCREADLHAYEEKILDPSSIQFMALAIISQNPGISRQELLCRVPGDRSPSALSHLTGLLKKGEYIVFQRVGQEKKFFATPRGDEYVRTVLANKVYNTVQEQSAALADNLIRELEFENDFNGWYDRDGGYSSNSMGGQVLVAMNPRTDDNSNLYYS